MIFDHTHVFSLGTVWDAVQLKRFIGEKFCIEELNQSYYNNLIHVKNLGIDYEYELHEYKNIVKKLKKDDLYGITEDTNRYWNLPKEYFNILVDYLFDRFSRKYAIIKYIPDIDRDDYQVITLINLYLIFILLILKIP